MNGKFHFRRTGPIKRMIKRPRPGARARILVITDMIPDGRSAKGRDARETHGQPSGRGFLLNLRRATGGFAGCIGRERRS